MCLRPLKLPHGTVGCGKCQPCCINKRRVIVARLMLEARDHPASFFCTLTYDKEHLPDGDKFPGGNLRPTDLQLFLKLLRRRYSAGKVRYYARGEYGDRTGRAHYHIILYCNFFLTQDMVRGVWGRGNVDVKLFSEGAASYIAAYVVGESERSDGRHPEFTRQSLKPGIGYGCAVAIAQECFQRYGVDYIAAEADVPSVVRIQGKVHPVGDYLRRKIREEVGLDEPSRRRQKTILKMRGPRLSRDDVAKRERRRRTGAYRARRLMVDSKGKERL